MINLGLAQSSQAVLAARAAQQTIATRHVHGTYTDTTGITVYGNWTWGHMHTLAAAWTEIQIGLPNNGAATLSGVTAIIAPTNTAAQNAAPAGASWTPVTFGGAASATLSAATDPFVPTVTWSDWMKVPSIARTDGGTLPLLLARVYNPQPGYPIINVTNATVNFPTKFEATNPGRISRAIGGSGNQVATPGAWPASVAQNVNYQHAMYIRYKTNARVITVYGCGDSIMSGYEAEGRVSFASRAAFAASTAQRPVEYCCGGWASRPATKYIERLQSVIGVIKPQIVPYMVTSTNDIGYGQAGGTALAQTNAAQFIALCGANAAVPILMTPLPWNPAAASTQAELVTRRTWITAQPQAKADMLPLHASADFGHWNGGTLRTSDGTHPNELGTADMTAILTAAISAATAGV
jgi:hypothetical protein